MSCLSWPCQLFCFQLLLLYSQSSAKLCSHDQSSALLQFKQLFSFENHNSDNCAHWQQSYPKMKHWKEDKDCCRWDGVTCDMATGHVISLDLSCSWLYGNFPSNTTLFFLPHLQDLNLAFNDFNYSHISSGFGRLTSLKLFNFSSSNFMGSVPASLGNLTQLTSLDLSLNNFSGHIPSSLSDLKHLDWLDLSSNNFIGEIPNIFLNLTKLSSLLLSSNQLTGPIPSSLSELRNLEFIMLRNNSLNGIIPSWLFTLPLLDQISLGENQLTGSIPSTIFEHVNLTRLDLSSNHLSGNVELYMFAKLKNLQILLLSSSGLSLRTTLKVNSSLPNLVYLRLAACNLIEFPDILKTQHQLYELDLSNNNIHGRIPNWMWDVGKDTLQRLYLSHNLLTSVEQLPWKNLELLDLRSNLLHGSLMLLPPFIRYFSVANNKLTGEIPSSFCNLSSIEYLDLSNNSLSGNISQILGNSNSLSISTLANCSSLSGLNLHGNQLGGPLPPFLINCTSLEVLDVGNNKINDTFPHWLANLPKLQVLILRSNKFHGPISNSNPNIQFSKLRVLDLSHNELSGVLPTKYFENFEAMMQKDQDGLSVDYLRQPVFGGYYSVIITTKGIDMSMERILTIFTIMDLSSNKLQGQIPEDAGKLILLKGLNLSHNNLTGHIPSSLGKLIELESLDLSSNKLVGKIPTQLANLTSLSVLNLSYNQLEGLIPRGSQLDTFDNKSYIGNLELCGFPLSQECRNDETLEQRSTVFSTKESDDNSSWFDWKLAMMGYESGLVIGLSVGYMVFATGRPLWFVRMLRRKPLKKVKRFIKRGEGKRN